MPSADPFGADATFHHVGLAVRSIEAVAPGADIVEDPIQNVRVSFVDWNGARMEFIEPVDESSPVTRSLKTGQRLQHLCFEVDSLDAALPAAAARGFHSLGKPVPAVAFGGRRIAWVYHAVFGLFELLER